jgi:hypothetical protein
MPSSIRLVFVKHLGWIYWWNMYLESYKLCLKLSSFYALTCPYMPLHTLACPYMPLHALTCPTCPYMLLHALTCPYIPLHALTCPYMPLHALTCPYMPLHALTYPCMPLHALTCPYMPLHALHALTCSYMPYMPLHALTWFTKQHFSVRWFVSTLLASSVPVLQFIFLTMSFIWETEPCHTSILSNYVTGFRILSTIVTSNRAPVKSFNNKPHKKKSESTRLQQRKRRELFKAMYTARLENTNLVSERLPWLIKHKNTWTKSYSYYCWCCFVVFKELSAL